MTDRSYRRRRRHSDTRFVAGLAAGLAIALVVLAIAESSAPTLARMAGSGVLSIDPLARLPVEESTVDLVPEVPLEAAPSAPVAPAPMGEVVVEGSGPGIAFLDGHPAGGLPTVIDSVTAGTHRLEIRDGEALLHEREIDVEADAVNIEVFETP